MKNTTPIIDFFDKKQIFIDLVHKEMLEAYELWVGIREGIKHIIEVFEDNFVFNMYLTIDPVAWESLGIVKDEEQAVKFKEVFDEQKFKTLSINGIDNERFVFSIREDEL